MKTAQELQLQTTDDRKEQNNSHKIRTISQNPQQQKLRRYKWWVRVSLYTFSLLTGQSAATLLERVYLDEGGSSEWMLTFVQTAGFSVLIPLILYYSPRHAGESINKLKPKFSTLVWLYFSFGLFLAGGNLMGSYGLLYLPVSTFSLLCATQLAFNAVFSYFLNSQKFTAFIFNSIVLVTISASLLAVDADSGDSDGISTGNYIIGFLCTLGSSAAFSLYLSLMQVFLDKVIKRETFSAVLDMQFYPSLVATCACVVGLFASREWKTLGNEMNEYKKGRVSYILTLVWIALTWQISSIGMVGLILEVSSLFSNLIGTLALPVVPILAAFLFHDKINGVKVVALLLAFWGFLSYIYQNYLDDKKSKADKSCSGGIEDSRGEVEIC